MRVQCDGRSIQVTVDDGASSQKSHEVLPDADAEEDAVPSDDADIKRFFYLKNSGTQDLVLDVEGMSGKRGTPVILWDQKFSTNHDPGSLVNQLWYEDTDTSTIRTAMNDFCLDLFGQSYSYYLFSLPLVFVTLY